MYVNDVHIYGNNCTRMLFRIFRCCSIHRVVVFSLFLGFMYKATQFAIESDKIDKCGDTLSEDCMNRETHGVHIKTERLYVVETKSKLDEIEHKINMDYVPKIETDTVDMNIKDNIPDTSPQNTNEYSVNLTDHYNVGHSNISDNSSSQIDVERDNEDLDARQDYHEHRLHNHGGVVKEDDSTNYRHNTRDNNTNVQLESDDHTSYIISDQQNAQAYSEYRDSNNTYSENSDNSKLKNNQPKDEMDYFISDTNEQLYYVHHAKAVINNITRVTENVAAQNSNMKGTGDQPGKQETIVSIAFPSLKLMCCQEK